MTDRSTAAAPRQRWQLLFSRGEPALRLRQADLVNELERAFREANLPLSYTGAQKPTPRIKLAANLPVGIELRGEVVEAYFDELVPIDRIEAAGELFPDGVELRDAKEVWHGFPSAASQLRGAEYEVEVCGDDAADLRTRCAARSCGCWPPRSCSGKRRRGESERRSDAGDRDLRPADRGRRGPRGRREGATPRGCGRSSSSTPAAPGGPRTWSARSTCRCGSAARSGPGSSSLTLPPSPDRLRAPAG